MPLLIVKLFSNYCNFSTNNLLFLCCNLTNFSSFICSLNEDCIFSFSAAKTWITRQVSVVAIKPCPVLSLHKESCLFNMLHSSTGICTDNYIIKRILSSSFFGLHSPHEIASLLVALLLSLNVAWGIYCRARVTRERHTFHVRVALTHRAINMCLETRVRNVKSFYPYRHLLKQACLCSKLRLELKIGLK